MRVVHVERQDLLNGGNHIDKILGTEDIVLQDKALLVVLVKLVAGQETCGSERPT